MAFVVEQPGSSRWTITRRVYPEQITAEQQLRQTKAARLYWEAIRGGKDHDEAITAAATHLHDDEFSDPDFLHILHKLSPYA